jgi:hypothetical protein
VAAGATLRRLDIPIVDELQTGLRTGFAGDCGRIEIVDVFQVTDSRLRIAVALQAKCHAEGLLVRYDFHFVNLAVALNAADATINVSRVIKVSVVGGLVDPYPRNRITGGIALTDWCQ